MMKSERVAPVGRGDEEAANLAGEVLRLAEDQGKCRMRHQDPEARSQLSYLRHAGGAPST